VAESFSCLNFLPTTLSVCSFAEGPSEWVREKPCFESLQRFRDSMAENLVRFEEILTVLGKDAQTEHQVMLDKADHCLHIMQSALADRFALKAAVDELKETGAEFFEMSNPNTDLQIPNQKWLVKLRLSHKHCDAFMMCMDMELFRMRGDIVWVMPRDLEF